MFRNMILLSLMLLSLTAHAFMLEPEELHKRFPEKAKAIMAKKEQKAQAQEKVASVDTKAAPKAKAAQEKVASASLSESKPSGVAVAAGVNADGSLTSNSVHVEHDDALEAEFWKRAEQASTATKKDLEAPGTMARLQEEAHNGAKTTVDLKSARASLSSPKGMMRHTRDATVPVKAISSLLSAGTVVHGSVGKLPVDSAAKAEEPAAPAPKRKSLVREEKRPEPKPVKEAYTKGYLINH